jgi:AGZA family xanthine/uracil permease-like MFS transporter
MARYGWAKWGDLNGFFALMIDNVTVMLILVVTVSASDPFGNDPALTDTAKQALRNETREFVLTRMIPGSAIGVLIGDLVYTWMAFRLARKSGRTDVTAMPLGLDTPSAFGVAFFIILPVLDEGYKHSLDHHAALTHAWHVGAIVLIMIGVFKTIFAPLGNRVRQWVPRAGLLGSLAAIALCLIAFLPLVDKIAAVPVVGILSLTVILVTLVAYRSLPFQIPGALAALLIGILIYQLSVWLEQFVGPLVPHHSEQAAGRVLEAVPLIPALDWEAAWKPALQKLPIALPFALATIVGGIDCTESAAAAGDEYDTRTILLTEGLASVAAGLCGGVLQNTPYIGQPAYKAMGSRAAYTLATGLFVGAAGYLGFFPWMMDWLPEAAMFPILVYVGLEIGAQSFKATPTRHYAALALAMLPAMAALGNILVGQVLGPNAPAPGGRDMRQTLLGLSNGFIVTSLLWGAALAALLDGRLKLTATYLGVAGVFSLFGIVHSPLADARIALPASVVAQLRQTHGDQGIALIQTPFHWACAYGLAAAFVLALEWLPGKHVAGHPMSPLHRALGRT